VCWTKAHCEQCTQWLECRPWKGPDAPLWLHHCQGELTKSTLYSAGPKTEQ
jgi:hypothetical protein